jgi:uncharacterized protein YjbI with pentapeptide repeats
MLNDLLPTFSEDSFERAIETLTAHMNNKTYYRPRLFEAFDGAYITDDYSTKNRRQSYYKNCTFKGANLSQTGFAGSVFIDTEFIDCDFNFCNLQSCDFRNCTFINNIESQIIATRFSKSIFYECEFNNMYFKGANFCDSIFTDSKFINCLWHSVAFENVNFKNILLKNVKFRSQNFEFAKFGDIHMEDIKLPFPTIPYIFSGIEYLIKTNDNTMVTTRTNESHYMPKEEYLNLLPELEIYYTNTQNYFPLANILIAQNKVESAYDAILAGINITIKGRNFRMIKYFCLQLNSISNFDIKYKRNLYSFIMATINKEYLLPIEYDNLNLYIGEIRRILLIDNDSPHVIFNIQTNIMDTEYQKISILLKKIDKLAYDIAGHEEQHYIELSHNSPYELFITFISSTDNMIKFINSFYVSIMGILLFIEKIEQIHKLKLENKKLTEDLRIQNSDNCKRGPDGLEKSNKPLSNYCGQTNSDQEELKTNNIYIKSGNHYIVNLSIDIDPEIRSHSFIRTQ